MPCADCDEERRREGGEPVRNPGPRDWIKAFWFRAYNENVTGLSGMVAYNLLLAVFPFALLVLFVFSQILRIEGIESSVFEDLRLLFPQASEETLRDILNAVRSNSATIGVVAVAASIWIGASFWGAMDTAFCRIYHVRCRGWWEQKRFSLVMLLVVVAFFLATVILPAVEGAVLRSTDGLPFGLDEVQGIDDLVLISLTLALNFLVCSVIFWLVPKGHMPWRAVWPGALFTTVVTGIANWLFPIYLTNVSTMNLFGSTAAFVLIALIWFYAVALMILAGAVINSLRHELHDTGALPYLTAGPIAGALGSGEDEGTEAGAAIEMAEPYRSLTAGEGEVSAADGNGNGGGNGQVEREAGQPIPTARDRI